MDALDIPAMPQNSPNFAPDTTSADEWSKWPTDAPKPAFAVGGVYRFLDAVTDEPRTAHIITEQTALVNGHIWHVAELPTNAEYVGMYAVDKATLADIRRFVREVLAWQRGS